MRLWEDGFDHYGDDETKLLDNAYANAALVTLSTTQVATGTHSLYINEADGDGTAQPNGLRKVLDSAIDKIGVAARFYFPDAPLSNTMSAIFDLYTSSLNNSHLCCFVDSNGALRFYSGNSYGFPEAHLGTLIATSDPIIGMAAWNHIELQAYIHDTAGWIRVAVNGVHRFQATDLDTRFNSDNIVSVHHHIFPFAGGSNTQWDYYMDDLYYYDFTGNPDVDTDFCPHTDGAGIATDYIGDLQVWPLFPNGDTAQAAWAKSSGTVGFSLIDEVPPDDSGYIFSSAAADLSEFALDDLPTTITYIRGLGIHQRLSKSDAGAAQTQVGMKSVAATSDATARVMTVAPAYWRDMVNVDPNSSARWTRASLNAAWLRFTRSV